MSLKELTVIANCHCLPIAEALALSTRNVTAEFIDVSFMDQPHMVAKIDRLAEAGADDAILSFQLSGQMGRLETDSLRRVLGSRLKTFTNIHFSGLHPDITYIGAMRQRLTGFFGDYHSKLVLYCFATGRSIESCLGLFSGKTYEKIGYFQTYASASEELLRRDENCEIKFAARFLEMVREEPSLYTINHPTGPVFQELAAALAGALGLDFIKYSASNFQNHLSSNYIWPVYDELAEQHGLAYRTPPYFVRENGRNARSADLPEFVTGSYAAYAQTDFKEFEAMVRNLPFFGTFSELL